MLAEVVAVVGNKNHDGVFAQAQAIQGLEQAADLPVHEAHAGVIGAYGLALLLAIHAPDPPVPSPQGCLRHVLSDQDLRQADMLCRVGLEATLRGNQRHMRTHEAHRQEKGGIRFEFNQVPGAFRHGGGPALQNGYGLAGGQMVGLR